MLYDIWLGNERVGQASVEQQGLYYKIQCHCRLTGAVRYHIRVAGSRGEENLGLLVPEGKTFCLSGSVAVKKLGEELRFSLTPRHPEQSGMFLPLRTDEAFVHLAKLKDAVFTCRNGQPGLLVQTSREISKPTGQ